MRNKKNGTSKACSVFCAAVLIVFMEKSHKYKGFEQSIKSINLKNNVHWAYYEIAETANAYKSAISEKSKTWIK